MLDARSRRLLIDTGHASVRHGVQTGERGTFVADAAAELPPEIYVRGSCFVTLTRNGELRGCCGTLEAERALIEDVWYNAFAAAFLDPRFMPVGERELADLKLEISVLTPLERVSAASREEVLAMLRPGRDGLVLQWRATRVTFIPHVWEQLTGPEEFLLHLTRKAQWPEGFWASDMQAWRYQAESIQ